MIGRTQDDSAKERHAFWAWLVVALVVHATALLLGHGARVHSIPAPPLAVVEYTIDDVARPSEPERMMDERAAEPSPATAHPLVGRREDVSSEGAGAFSGPVAPSSSSGAQASAEPARTADDQGSWSVQITRAPANIGLNKSAFENGLVAATPEARGAPASSARVRSILRDGLSQHDIELGMARGGVVVSVAKDAVSRSLVPDESFAIIEVRFDSAGHATSARVVESQNDLASWNDAVKTIATQLDDRSVRVPEHAAGLSVFVRIDVSLRLPSGARGSIAPSAGGATFDLSDIGARKSRNVAARIVSERAF